MSLQTIELDVRVIPPRDKHPTIFKTFDSLASGQAMVTRFVPRAGGAPARTRPRYWTTIFPDIDAP